MQKTPFLFLPDSSIHRVMIARFIHEKTLHVLSSELVMLRKTRNYFITSCETISDSPHILVPRDRNKILVDILAIAMINL